MGTDMNKEIAALRRMTAGQLRDKYIELFGEKSRSGNRDWLFRRCAWRTQALAEGGLSDRAETFIRNDSTAGTNRHPLDRQVGAPTRSRGGPMVEGLEMAVQVFNV